MRPTEHSCSLAPYLVRLGAPALFVDHHALFIQPGATTTTTAAETGGVGVAYLLG